jgi:hypothetical protein
MSRGRLIRPFVVELYQLDTAATSADPDGAGPLTSGYDPDFRTPIKVLEDPGDQVGKTTRTESGPIQIRAQIEPTMFERLEMMLSGSSPEFRFAVVAHYKELETLGLVDSRGRPKIYPQDRLSRILTVRGDLVEEIPDPPGLYIREVQSRGYGLGYQRNLLLIHFETRDQSLRTAAG